MRRIKTGDIVVVTAGKDRGKQGRVLRLVESRDRVVVEGVNFVTKHRKKNPQDPAAGGRTKMEAPIHVSNVMPWSDKDGKGVRVRYSGVGKDKIRVSAASGEKLVASAPSATAAKGKEKGKKKKGGDESRESD